MHLYGTAKYDWSNFSLRALRQLGLRRSTPRGWPLVILPSLPGGASVAGVRASPTTCLRLCPPLGVQHKAPAAAASGSKPTACGGALDFLLDSQPPPEGLRLLAKYVGLKQIHTHASTPGHHPVVQSHSLIIYKYIRVYTFRSCKGFFKKSWMVNSPRTNPYMHNANPINQHSSTGTSLLFEK
jgi:hypothetical protein